VQDRESVDTPRQPRIRWEPRVPRAAIWQLYQRDAEGIVDDALIDEVAFGLLARCQSMLEVTASLEGRAKCFGCGEIITHEGDEAVSPEQVPVRCPGCGWEVTWGEYFQSFTGRHLRTGAAQPVVEAYVQQMQRGLPPQGKMRLIDWLLHEFHKDLRTGRDTKPLAVCVIEGRSHQIVELLDTLAYGASSTPGLEATAREWRQRRRETQSRR